MADSNNSFGDKVIRKLKSGTWYPFYNTFYEKVPIDRRVILLASRKQGLPWKAISPCVLLTETFPARNTAKFRKVLAVSKIPMNRVEKKLARYHISVDKIIHMSTPDYYYHLAKAGYLINDTTFPETCCQGQRPGLSQRLARYPARTHGTGQRERDAMTWEISCEIS